MDEMEWSELDSDNEFGIYDSDADPEFIISDEDTTVSTDSTPHRGRPIQPLLNFTGRLSDTDEDSDGSIRDRTGLGLTQQPNPVQPRNRGN